MADEDTQVPQGTEDDTQHEGHDDAEALAAADNPDAVRNALARERDAARAAKRESDELRTQVKQYEDRDKSEQDLLAERATQAEMAAAESHVNYLRLKVGGEKGLSPTLAERLNGGNEQEMAADADRLLAALGDSQQRAPSSGGPRQPAAQPDMNTFIRQGAGRS